MKQKLTELKGETENSTVIVGNFNIPLPYQQGNRKLEQH